MYEIEKAGDGDCLINTERKGDVKEWEGEILVTDNLNESVRENE
jgi:hypothetical protein